MTHITTSSSTPAARTPPPGERTCESTLRRVLRLNALSSSVAGAVLAAIPHPVDDLLGTGHPGWVRVVGVALLPFAALCLWVSTASLDVLHRVTPEIVVADVAWVVVSVVTVLIGWYSGGGIVAVLAMAAAVDVFALLQWMGWRRLRATA